jgi:hypothetical protein
MGEIMTNEPGFRMVVEKLKQQLEGFLKVFNVTLPAAQAQAKASSAVDVNAPVAVPLEIGNELLITDDLVKLQKNLTNARGRVVIIDQLPANDYEAIRASAFGIQVNVNMKTARLMREAYIFREQTSTAV